MRTRALAGWLVAVLAVPAGIGVLYLERRLAVLDLGPRIPGALPLQQLAGGEDQPLLRLVVAWVGAGALAGLALGHATRARPLPALALLGALSLGLLLAAGAGADAVAVSDRVAPHLLPQLHRAATWVSTLLLLVGAGLSSRLARRGQAPAPATAPTEE
jgi:uncharacterized membrane protein (Fun14 family)